MRIVKIKEIIEATSAFVMVRFITPGPEKGTHVIRQCVLPKQTAPGIGDLCLFIGNRQSRPRWMKSPLLCYHGQSEVLSRRNDGGLFACRLWENKDGSILGWSFPAPRAGNDPAFQRWVNENDDLREVVFAVS